MNTRLSMSSSIQTKFGCFRQSLVTPYVSLFCVVNNKKEQKSWEHDWLEMPLSYSYSFAYTHIEIPSLKFLLMNFLDSGILLLKLLFFVIVIASPSSSPFTVIIWRLIFAFSFRFVSLNGFRFTVNPTAALKHFNLARKDSEW